MRQIGILIVFVAACGSTGTSTSRVSMPTASPDSKVRVVWNQYKGANSVFIMESIGERDLVELRSSKLRKGQVAIAYVPDDVMTRVLDEFRRFDWARHAVPRPADPIGLGAAGELTIVDRNDRRTSLLRIRHLGQNPSGAHIAAAKAYGRCTTTFLAAWNHFRPEMQVTTTGGAFGVKRAGDG